ncbi:phosphocarrier protein Chr [Tetzosporium hominis]|uniref:Phosphocarrier protein Chr n=2 Tax=Caryophanaceae TaxID=186818 RepID=A0A264W3Z3_9BACL|nr:MULTISPECIES: HPr family phosphocarrier protein [Planococcaceae]OZS78271.1 phosphocarrier protein Chr [Tetzosporium hominis]PJK17177.1 phosphocarrier protein Chr [Chryseomicrobium excrementi]
MEKTMDVGLSNGLQARQAALFVQEANRFASEIFLEKDGKKVNAKSIMGIMSLAVGRGEEVVLYAEGSDEEAAIDTLTKFITEN